MSLKIVLQRFDTSWKILNFEPKCCWKQCQPVSMSLFCKYMVNTVLWCVCFAQMRNINFLCFQRGEGVWMKSGAFACRKARKEYLTRLHKFCLDWHGLLFAKHCGTTRFFGEWFEFFEVQKLVQFCVEHWCVNTCVVVLLKVWLLCTIYSVFRLVELNRHAACSWSTYRARQKVAPLRSIYCW